MKIVGPIPNKVYLAFSGGGDSCAALSFLLNGRKDVELLHFHHGTEHAQEAARFAQNVAKELKLKIHIGRISNFREQTKKESKEEYWRNARYDFFKNYGQIRPIITVHHLDDCVETWIFTSLNGSSSTIPYKREDVNVIRPFLAATREELMGFLRRRGPQALKKWVDDPSNEDTKYMRNLIRHEIVPAAIKVNPGLHKVVRRKILASLNTN